MALRSTYEVKNTGWCSLLLSLLGEVKETLTSLGRPGSGGVGNLGLLATKVAAQVLVRNRLLAAEPEVLLGELQAPTSRLAFEK